MDQNRNYKKINGFKLYCYNNTAGHQYAVDNGFDYELLDVCSHPSPAYFSARAATCTTGGNSAYYYCSDCGKYFNDSSCTNEIAKADTYIPANSHTAEKVEAKAATCEEDGNTEYWYCDHCDKYYSDAECTNEIAHESTVIPATGHKLVKISYKAPTATTQGRVACWYCRNCKRYFTDKNAKTEIAKADTYIPATGN